MSILTNQKHSIINQMTSVKIQEHKNPKNLIIRPSNLHSVNILQLLSAYHYAAGDRNDILIAQLNM